MLVPAADCSTNGTDYRAIERAVKNAVLATLYSNSRDSHVDRTRLIVQQLTAGTLCTT